MSQCFNTTYFYVRKIGDKDIAECRVKVMGNVNPIRFYFHWKAREATNRRVRGSASIDGDGIKRIVRQ